MLLFKFKSLGILTLSLLIHFPAEDSGFKMAQLPAISWGRFCLHSPSALLFQSHQDASFSPSSRSFWPCCCFPESAFFLQFFPHHPLFVPPNACFPRECWPSPFPSSALPVVGPSPCVASCLLLCQPASKGGGSVLSPASNAVPGARWTLYKY